MDKRLALAVDKRLELWAEEAGRATLCRRCPLYRDVTTTVFGEGPVPADVMLVGEQPGDREDGAGRPFVGPAGALLDRCLEEVGARRRTSTSPTR